MTDETNKYHKLGELILANLEGVAGDEELDQMRNLLSSDPGAAQYYLEYIMMYSGLSQPGVASMASATSKSPFEPNAESMLWQALAESEKSAIGIKVTREAEDLDEKDAADFGHRRKVIKRRRRISRFSLYTAICSTAALLALITYLAFGPSPPPIVAKLIDAVDAELLMRENQVALIGSELRIGHGTLATGFAQIRFKNGTEVIIQAPAEFELETEKQLFLRSGTLTCKAPKDAPAFVVRTYGATVIDYGTEFGVTASRSGETETHVFDGHVELRAGSDPIRFGDSFRLSTGLAAMVDTTGSISKSTFQSDRFVRNIHFAGLGKAGRRLDIADIVGGGNGLGNGTSSAGIDPTTGEPTIGISGLKDPGNYKGQYIPVGFSSFIDGVFIPNSGWGPAQISSAGHRFVDCPKTDGYSWTCISNNVRIRDDWERIFQLSLDGCEYGTPDKPGIVMHPNVGITFDLQAIRRAMPGIRIAGFSALFGVSEVVLDSMPSEQPLPKTDFWVLVDGRLCYSRKGMIPQRAAESVQLKLGKRDRFLTLIATDNDGYGNDWFFLAMPVFDLGPDN